MLERFIAGTATILVGFNIIAFGVWSNGDARLSNPVWRLLNSFLNFEIFVLKLLLAGILGSILYLAVTSVLDTKTSDPPPTKAETPKSATQRIPKTEVHPTTQIHESTEATPPPIPPTPTTEDLKRKAIEQIVRGF